MPLLIPVGYRLYCQAGDYLGELGQAYNYILASNGLWLEAENAHIRARVLLAPAEVRGLADLSPTLFLKHGRLPESLWTDTCDLLGDVSQPEEVQFVAVVWGDGYHLVYPPQESTHASVRFTAIPNAVLEVHTHPGMGAFFSGTDDADRQGFRLYGVLGVNAGYPAVRLRLGVYGYMLDVPWSTIFEGSHVGWHDLVAQEGGKALVENIQ